MSAWIEIKIYATVHFSIGVALYMSAWIEITGFLLKTSAKAVALYMSAWIEINRLFTTEWK